MEKLHKAIDAKERYITGIVYDAISQLLPALGRDFNVMVMFDDQSHLKVDIVALTDLGKLIKADLLSKLQNKFVELMQRSNNQRRTDERTTDTRADTRADTHADTSA